ncbi:MAG: DNA polymerase III subunit gamma/tau [Pyrinomonadaceae bacterium]|nr:DNA polymerase III subunit gamma/tau [Pyrinomonadaceae bacterium]MBP6213092.1 DNA polymerase III subunit gamma/tau [Pyrinomonadaceae bacterium]
MSYQVIARKWRPQTFEEVTGQEVITHTLRNAIEHDRLHHAYLFSGARGVGKTTTARILAKSLNCHKTDKPNLQPCSTNAVDACPSCLEISESRSLDVMEFDAASNTQVEKIRDIVLDGIQVRPARDRYKIFIIDEVHQLSNHSFNALLKTIEEPPDDVVFIMATTELHKVPVTIQSRCQEFEFRTIALQKIYDRLRLIADAEKIDVSDDALREIARSGEGSMRDAQSNFDQVISFSGEKITTIDVAGSLGFAGVEILTRVVNAIAGRDAKELLNVVDDLVARGHDLRNFCRDMLGVFRDMMVFKVAGDDPKFFETAVIDAADMARMSEGFTESDVLRFFNSLAETETKLKEASHSRYVLEIGLVKLIEMRRVTSVESLLERLDAIASGVPSTASTVPPTFEEKKTLNLVEPVSKTAERVPETIPEPELEPSVPVLVEPEPPPVLEIEPPIEFFDEPPFDLAEPPDLITEPPVDPPPEPPRPIVERSYKPSFDAKSMPVRLPMISAEDLEHIDDKVLDNAYEEKLAVTGDDLLPLKSSLQLVEILLGNLIDEPRPMSAVLPPVQSSAATAPAYDISSMLPAPEPEIVAGDMPNLSSAPTEEELLAYANSHPAVQRAVRIFRGKIVGVALNRSKSGT